MKPFCKHTQSNYYRDVPVSISRIIKSTQYNYFKFFVKGINGDEERMIIFANNKGLEFFKILSTDMKIHIPLYIDVNLTLKRF